RCRPGPAPWWWRQWWRPQSWPGWQRRRSRRLIPADMEGASRCAGAIEGRR
ncbi:RNA helicase, partial [Stenotrophomonas maltophilia]